MGGGMGGYSSRTTVIPRHYHSYSTVVPIVPAPALPFVPFGGPTVIAPVMPGPVYGSPYRVMDTMFNVVFGFFSIFAIATAFQKVRQGRMGAADSFADAGAGALLYTHAHTHTHMHMRTRAHTPYTYVCFWQMRCMAGVSSDVCVCVWCFCHVPQVL